LGDSRGIVLGGPLLAMIGRAAREIVPGSMDKVAGMMAEGRNYGSLRLLKTAGAFIVCFKGSG
jgi:hypothetical protein